MAKKRAARTIRRPKQSKRTAGRTRTRTVAPKRTRLVTRETNTSRVRNKRTAESRSRSIAALKGWRTRRATAKKRSTAARKGWDTRRKNIRSANRTRARNARKPVAPATTGQPGGGRTKEFIGAADYAAKKRSSSVSIQISAFGPADATAKDAERAIKERIATGHAPKGWNVRLMDWKSPHAWKQFAQPLKHASIKVE